MSQRNRNNSENDLFGDSSLDNPFIRITKEYMNWNWVGLIAATFTLVVTARNLKQYYDAIRKGES